MQQRFIAPSLSMTACGTMSTSYSASICHLVSRFLRNYLHLCRADRKRAYTRESRIISLLFISRFDAARLAHDNECQVTSLVLGITCCRLRVNDVTAVTLQVVGCIKYICTGERERERLMYVGGHMCSVNAVCRISLVGFFISIALKFILESGLETFFLYFSLCGWFAIVYSE